MEFTDQSSERLSDRNLFLRNDKKNWECVCQPAVVGQGSLELLSSDGKSLVTPDHQPLVWVGLARVG